MSNSELPMSDATAFPRSSSGRPGLLPYDRRHLDCIDAIRLGERQLAERLAEQDLGAQPWSIGWASATDLDSRLRLKLHVGGIATFAPAAIGEDLRVATVARPNDHVRVWDLWSGDSIELRTSDVRLLSFAQSDSEPVVVTAHRGGLLRVWNTSDVSLRSSLTGGNSDIVKMEAVGPNYLITLSKTGCVVRWDLSAGERVVLVHAASTKAISTGHLADGRPVVIVASDGLTVCDLESGHCFQLPVRERFRNIGDVTIATVRGRDSVVVLTSIRDIVSFDLETGEQIARTIVEHRNYAPDDRMRVWTPPEHRPTLTAVSGIVAVPTAWRVHLWDLATSEPYQSPLTGPVAASLVRTVGFGGRDFLVTGATKDGVVALWDLEVAPRASTGHEDQVVAIAKSPHTVMSVDAIGDLVMRGAVDGRPLAEPVRTKIQHLHAMLAWTIHNDLICAVAGGSPEAPDGAIRRYNVTRAGSFDGQFDVDAGYVRRMALIDLDGDGVIAVPQSGGKVGFYRTADGQLLRTMQTKMYTQISGLAVGAIDGRPVVVLSAYRQPLTLYYLDSIQSPLVIPGAENEFVVEVVDGRLVLGSCEGSGGRWTTVRARELSGQPCGPAIRGAAEVTAAALDTWPNVFIARKDGYVSLTDVTSGQDLCRPILLSRTPEILVATGDGGVVVGFGSDGALLRPPAR